MPGNSWTCLRRSTTRAGRRHARQAPLLERSDSFGCEDADPLRLQVDALSDRSSKPLVLSSPQLDLNRIPGAVGDFDLHDGAGDAYVADGRPQAVAFVLAAQLEL